MELYFNNIEELDQEFPADQLNKWDDEGSPNLWVEAHDFWHNSDHIRVWSDYGYGGIMLTVNYTTYSGMDIVQNGDYVALSPEYSREEQDSEIRVFHQIKGGEL